MKTLLPLLVIFLSFITTSFSQDIKVKFGKVSPADLAMKVYPSDTGAIAVVLSKIGRMRYDVLTDKYPLTEDRHIVIKLLTDAGIDEYGDVKIQYYSYKDYSKVANIKAMVHLPDGTDIKVDNSQIFDEQTNDYWSTKKIAFPGLVKGAIIEYQYTIFQDYMFQPVDWFFQSYIPIRYAELTTKIPDWYEYVVLTQGLPLDKNAREENIETIHYTNVSRSDGIITSSQTNHETANVNFIINTFINQDVPALKEECCITTMDDYYSRVRYQLQAYHFAMRPREPVLNSWNKLAEELYQDPQWGGQLKNKRPGSLVLEAAGITVDTSVNQMETAQLIYDYINNNVQWNDMQGYGGSRDISTILKTKSGNSGDLNKLMCAALIQAGIDAQPVLLSTRDNGKPLELYPFIDQFNHMVVVANIEGKDMWMDLGDKNLPMGLLRADVLNSRGWLVDEKNPAWIDIVPASSNSTYLITGTLDKEGNLNATVESRYTGYHAVEQRTNADDEKEKFGENILMSGTNPMKLADIEMINKKEISKPFQLKAKVINQSVATVTPDKIYLNPLFTNGMDELPFKLEERTYPIEMNYPEEVTMILNLTLPEGYTVESIPKPIKFVTENNGIQASYNSSQTPGKLNVTMKYTLKQLAFDPTEYTALKNFYNERHQKFNEQIVLTKS
ncbi:MAG: DUF3857 and transglutaminase domain-containing protein [Saprospiraceae bacterium]|uniref:DUF3857 and transglutaminase domain-containing protein n=1 Tax=Candidatus Opimibacter skivensis TaxID=2982028 RepID=A0A9D7XNS4_9BACT|nr:DUF3857 and transglutaminase domain-containing protein [Candidatus Opimibacter skivensis]